MIKSDVYITIVGRSRLFTKLLSLIHRAYYQTIPLTFSTPRGAHNPSGVIRTDLHFLKASHYQNCAKYKQFICLIPIKIPYFIISVAFTFLFFLDTSGHDNRSHIAMIRPELRFWVQFRQLSCCTWWIFISVFWLKPFRQLVKMFKLLVFTQNSAP